MQAIEMLADAQTGEFERLKEFGVRAIKAGEQITFTYLRNGQEIRRTARNNAVEIQRALLGIFDVRFGGMMDRQARTLSGMWSNLMDSIANFQLDVADGGFFDFVKSQLGDLLDWVNAKANDGSLKRWAHEVSVRMTEMAKAAREFVNGVRWSDVGESLQTAVDVSRALLHLLGRIVATVQWFHRNSGLVNSSALPFGGQLFDLARNRQPFQPAAPVQPRRPATVTPDQRRRMWTPNAPLPGLPNSGGRAPASPSVARPISSRIAVDINLTGPGAREASIRSVRSEGSDLEASVYRGRAMALPA